MPQITYHDDEFELRDDAGVTLAFLAIKATVEYKQHGGYEISQVLLMTPGSLAPSPIMPRKDCTIYPALADMVQRALLNDHQRIEAIESAIGQHEECSAANALEDQWRDYRRAAL